MTPPLPPKHIVLYADDDADDLLLVEEAFADYGWDVDLKTWSNGADVLNYLNNMPVTEPAPCLIILDINMPKMSGKETLVKIRQLSRFANVPVIFFTTSSMQRDKDFAASYEAGLLTKPIDINGMEGIINRFLTQCTQVENARD
ncbi:MAG: response regulator [Chitinophagaceae bacterium]